MARQGELLYIDLLRTAEVVGNLISYCLEKPEVINTPQNQAFFSIACKNYTQN